VHSLVCGMTESGKSALSKLIATGLKKTGKIVAVLDPLDDPTWDACVNKKFTTIEALDEWLTKINGAHVFIDEGGEVFDEGRDKSFAWLATRSRHYGHSVYFIAQRAMQIPKTMRDQCSRLYLFTSSASDGKLHAEEWNKPELEQCNEFPKLHFAVCSRFDQIQWFNIHKSFKKIEEWKRKKVSKSNAD